MTRTISLRLAAIPALTLAVALALAQHKPVSGGTKPSPTERAAAHASIIDLYTRQVPVTVAVFIGALVIAWAVGTGCFQLSMDRSGPARAGTVGHFAWWTSFILVAVLAHFFYFARPMGA